MQLFEFFFQTSRKKSIKEMHQSALTCQQHEQQLPGLPTYAEAIRTGPSNQPLSTPVYVGYLTPGVKVQAPLGDPSIRTHMPTHSPYSTIYPANDDLLNGENPPASTVVYVSPNTSTQGQPRKCGKLINNNRSFDLSQVKIFLHIRKIYKIYKIYIKSDYLVRSSNY